MTLTPEQIEQLVQRAIANERLKATGTNPGTPPTGPQGLFNTPGLNPNIVTTYIPPNGIEDYLEQSGAVRSNMYTNEVFGIITGQKASTGSEPTEPCDDNVPIAGSLKMCQQTWPFGEITMKSQVIRLDTSGQLMNSGSPIGLNLLNDPFNTELANQVVPQSPTDMFRSTVAKLTVELANDFKRRYARLVWTGNPSNTSASAGGYLEFNGLDRIINTGYRDSITGAACAAADSLVMDFSSAIAQNNAAKTVRWFVEATRAQKYLATQIDFGQVNFAWVMRYQLFLSLTEIWPCAYYTFRCYTAAPSGSTATAFVDAQTQVALRDSMRAGMYLLIDGVQVPVIIDNTLAEENVGGGNFESNAYLLPLSAPGKFGDSDGKLTYMEYFNYNGPFGMSQALQGIPNPQVFKVSGDGRFVMMMLPPTNFCVQLLMRTRKRLIVRTPFLAARIDNIRYNVYNHEREWQPDTSFFVNGGNTSFAGQSFVSPIA